MAEDRKIPEEQTPPPPPGETDTDPVADSEDADGQVATATDEAAETKPDDPDELTDAAPADGSEDGPVDGPEDGPEETVEKPRESRTFVWPLVAGGMIAAALGFGVSLLTPGGWPVATQSEAMATLAARLDGADTKIAGLTTGFETLVLPDVDAALAPVTAQIADDEAAFNAALADISLRLAGFEARLGELEKRPIAGAAASSAAVAAYQRDLETLRAEFDQQRTGTEQALAVAADETRRARTNSQSASLAEALTGLSAAIDQGHGFSGQLNALQALGIAVPAELSARAGGVTTLADLRQSFAPAARAAIDAATRAGVADGSISRFQGFMRTQLGARSLKPRSGNSADAVLSRAEDAVAGGRLDAALTEVAALTAAGQAEMAAWTAAATDRQVVLTALAALQEHHFNAAPAE